MIESNKKNFRTHLAFMLASVFAAWGSYLIHVIPIEEPSLPILEALIELSGRAPDQYRVVPYLLIGLIQDAINSLPGIDVELRYPVFEKLSLDSSPVRGTGKIRTVTRHDAS